MWLFDCPKSYTDMLRKIAWTMFIIVMLCMVILVNVSSSFANLMSILSFKIKIEFYKVEIYASCFYFPIIFALLENIFKLHDRISDVFQIRYRFDKNVIIRGFMRILKLDANFPHVNKQNRKEIMRIIFYPYAGYAKPEIDPHLVYMALGSWSWYWIIIDTMLVAVFIGIIMLIHTFSLKLLLFLVGAEALLWVLSRGLLKLQCTLYANQEVSAILDDPLRSATVRNYLMQL